MAARELSFGDGAAAEEEEEEEEEAERWVGAEGEGVARLEGAEEERDVFWRGFEARVLVSPF